MSVSTKQIAEITVKAPFDSQCLLETGSVIDSLETTGFSYKELQWNGHMNGTSFTLIFVKEEGNE